jgi:4'-phosphopantetheinyl transferase
LRIILSRYGGDDPGKLSFAYGEYGKPSLFPFTDIQFNLSHSGDWAIVAVTRGIPVGVDVERIRPNVDVAALLRRLGEPDLAFQQATDSFNAWTRREARTKASGAALFNMPAKDVYAVDINAPAGYAAAVALVGHKPVPEYRKLQ